MSGEALFRHPHRIAFHETDAAGNVFGGRVVEHFLDALHHCLEWGGIHLSNDMQARWRLPIVHIEVDFREPMPFATKVFVEVVRLELRNTSLAVEYRVVAEEEPARIHATGKTVHVCIDSETRKKRPLPPELIELATKER